MLVSLTQLKPMDVGMTAHKTVITRISSKLNWWGMMQLLTVCTRLCFLRRHYCADTNNAAIRSVTNRIYVIWGANFYSLI